MKIEVKIRDENTDKDIGQFSKTHDLKNQLQKATQYARIVRNAGILFNLKRNKQKSDVAAVQCNSRHRNDKCQQYKK